MTMERKQGEDGISELPDDVQCHILSFLRTKEAMATSLLSSRWRFLWSMVPSLNIKCSKPIIESYKSINIFLGLRRTEEITRFRLNCDSDHCCSSYVEEWVSEVIARKVKEVDISLNRCDRSVLNLATLFTCTTVVKLRLCGRFNLSIPSSVHLPNLKILFLNIKTWIPISNTRKLISGSPALKLFDLKQKCYEVYFDRNSQGTRVNHSSDLYELEIKKIDPYDFIPDYAEDHRWPNIVKAKVYMIVHTGKKHSCVDLHASKVLRGLRNVEFLCLGDFRDEMDHSVIDFPLFKNLVQLRLYVFKADSSFMELPAKCPKLQVLEINILKDRNSIDQRFRYHIRDGVREHDLSIVTV